ncbi:hypothetical protein Bca4012_020590 [Brassica carinata]
MYHQRIYGGSLSAHLNLSDWLHSSVPANTFDITNDVFLRLQWLESGSIEHVQGGIYQQMLSHKVLRARLGITSTLLLLVQPGCSRCLLKKAEMLDARAQ